MNRLKEYNLKLHHRSSKDQHIELIDDLNKMLTRLQLASRHENQAQSTMMILRELESSLENQKAEFAKVRRRIFLARVLETKDSKIAMLRRFSMYY